MKRKRKKYRVTVLWLSIIKETVYSLNSIFNHVREWFWNLKIKTPTENYINYKYTYFSCTYANELFILLHIIWNGRRANWETSFACCENSCRYTWNKGSFSKENPASIIQPIAERIRMDTEADFIVVGNKEGIRYAHPERDKIGEAMIGGDNKGVLLEGKSYISKATGCVRPFITRKSSNP